MGALASAVVALGGATSTAVGAPVAASQNPSPFDTPGCLALEPQPGSRNYLNSEVEPQAAVDPTNPQHLVSAWQQDRWSNGGAHGLVAAFSNDGGASWNVSPQPFSACYEASGLGPALDYQRASDPWVSIGPGVPAGRTGTSTVYTVSISFDETSYKTDTNASHNAVGAAASYDGGATWSNVQTIIDDPCGLGSLPSPGYVCNNDRAYVFNDKESVTADPNHAGVAYTVWDRLVAPPASPRGFDHEQAYFGQTFISKTTDFGQTWSAPRMMFGLRSQDQTIGNQIVVDRHSGKLYDFFNLIQNKSNSGGHRGYSVAFSTSTDGGTTWSRPKVAAPLSSAGVSDPENLNPATNAAPAPSRTGDIIPEPAIDPITGRLYVVWQDARFNGTGNDEVVISTSSDGGNTWSAPQLVNSHTGMAAFDPSVFVDDRGVVAVSYFQWQPDIVAGNEPTAVWIRHSQNPVPATGGLTFDDPTQVDAPTKVDGPFNNLAAPVARGYFLGDYQGLVANADSFVPVYTKTNCADGGPGAQPSCRAIRSVLAPTTDRTPTGNNATDVYAAPGS